MHSRFIQVTLKKIACPKIHPTSVFRTVDVKQIIS